MGWVTFSSGASYQSGAYYACKWWGKRGAVVEWLEWLGYGAESRRKVVSSRRGFAIRLLENFLCQPSSKLVTFSESGKKAAKGAGWAPRFFCYARDTVGSIPTAPKVLGYEKPVP